MTKVWLVQAYGWGEGSPTPLAAFTSEERANHWCATHNADPSSIYGTAHVESFELDPEYVYDGATVPTG